MRHVVISTAGTTDTLDLRDVSTLEFSPGLQLTNTRGLSPPAHCLIGTAKPDAIRAHVKVPSPDGHFIDFLSSNQEGVTVQGVEVETLGTSAKLAAAVRFSGSKQVAINIRQVGVGRVLALQSAKGVIADLIRADTGSCREYCMFTGALPGPDIYTDDCEFRRFDLNGVHCDHAGRFEHTRRCTWGHATLTLPELANLPAPGGNKGFAARATQGKFTALAINDGEDAKVIRVLIDGMLATGPIPIWAGAHADWLNRRMLIEGCDIKTLAVNVGTVGLIVRHSIIRGIELDTGTLPGKPNYAPGNGQFEDTLFLCPPPSNPRFPLIRCRRGTKPNGSDAKPI